jgi:hypothetical protein
MHTGDASPALPVRLALALTAQLRLVSTPGGRREPLRVHRQAIGEGGKAAPAALGLVLSLRPRTLPSRADHGEREMGACKGSLPRVELMSDTPTG